MNNMDETQLENMSKNMKNGNIPNMGIKQSKGKGKGKGDFWRR